MHTQVYISIEKGNMLLMSFDQYNNIIYKQNRTLKK